MDKNSLIQDIKNDLNSIKKQVEITLAKLAVLESMIELDKKLGGTVAELVEAPVEELGVEKLEPVAEPAPEPVVVTVAEPVEAPVEELGVSNEELGVEKLEPVAEPAPEPVVVSVAEPVEAPVAEAQALRNLMSVISLGDKFRFRHDLFSDSNDLFKETIEILNTIEKFDEAVNYLQGKFNWDAEDATVVYFYDIIRPKF
jgi:hypothetical protein